MITKILPYLLCYLWGYPMTKCYMCHKKLALVVFLLLLFSFNLFIPKFVLGYNEDEANTSIQLADKAVCSAFKAVSEAESAGVDVSNFIARLNQASELLVEAMSLFKNGSSTENIVNVIELANHSTELANNVKNEMVDLKASALSYNDYILQIYIITSSVGVAIFIVFMFLSWRWFKHYYLRRLLGLKPEVVENANA